MMGLGEWDTVTRPEISHQNVRKHLCEESELLYMIKDQTSFQGSFKENKFSDSKKKKKTLIPKQT